MRNPKSFWTKELFDALEVGQVADGNKGSAHRVYLMNIMLAPKRFASRKNGTAVERVA